MMYVCVNVNVNVNVVVLVFGRRKVIILAFGDWKGKWNANFLHIHHDVTRWEWKDDTVSCCALLHG